MEQGSTEEYLTYRRVNFLHSRKKPFLDCMLLPEMTMCPVSFAKVKKPVGNC